MFIEVTERGGMGMRTRFQLQNDHRLPKVRNAGWRRQFSVFGALLALVAGMAVAVAPSAGAATPLGQAIVNAAAAEAGVHTYCTGAGNKAGPTPCNGSPAFDCSGLVLYAVYQASDDAIDLPRTAASMGADYGQYGGTLVSQANLEPGDLVFLGGNSMSTAAHVAVYAGGGTVWDANTAYSWKGGSYPNGVYQRSLSNEEAGLSFDGAVRFYGNPGPEGAKAAHRVSAVLTSSTWMNVFATTTTGQIEQDYWTASGGWGSEILPSVATAAGDPVAIMTSSTWMNVFATTTTGQIEQDYWTASGGWGSEILPSVATAAGDPVAIMTSSTWMNVFATTTTGQIEQDYWTATGGWGSEILPSVATAAGDPVAIMTSSTWMNVFATTTTGQIEQDYWTATGGWGSEILPSVATAA
jgi:cell wall-associated NlpC family hydrolase